MQTLPLMMVLFVPLAVGVHHLYDWARPEKVAADKHLREITRDFLNPTGFGLRSIIYLVIWGGLIYLLSRWSAQQDDPPVRDFSPRYKRLSAPGLILYVFAISFGAIDWVMSLDARWISTIYPLIFVAGQVLAAFCFVVVVEAILSRYSPMAQLLKPDELKDHGNMMLTFIMLWAYFSFSNPDFAFPCHHGRWHLHGLQHHSLQNTLVHHQYHLAIAFRIWRLRHSPTWNEASRFIHRCLRSPPGIFRICHLAQLLSVQQLHRSQLGREEAAHDQHPGVF